MLIEFVVSIVLKVCFAAALFLLSGSRFSWHERKTYVLWFFAFVLGDVFTKPLVGMPIDTQVVLTSGVAAIFSVLLIVALQRAVSPRQKRKHTIESFDGEVLDVFKDD